MLRVYMGNEYLFLPKNLYMRFRIFTGLAHIHRSKLLPLTPYLLPLTS
jgi:hypothetical protein